MCGNKFGLGQGGGGGGPRLAVVYHVSLGGEKKLSHVWAIVKSYRGLD